MAKELGIPVGVLLYYLGRYVQSDVNKEEMLNIVSRVVLLRNMGYSSLQINTIAECNCKIADITPARKIRMSREHYASVVQSNWSALTFVDCARLQEKSSFSGIPWYDRMFFGRLVDSQSIVVVIAIFLHYLLHRYWENSASIITVLLVSAFTSVCYAVVRTIGDLFRQKINIKIMLDYQ